MICFLNQDKILHLIVGFVLTLLGLYILNFLFLGVIFAFGKEIYDYITKRGHAEWHDILYTLMGCGLAFITSFWL